MLSSFNVYSISNEYITIKVIRHLRVMNDRGSAALVLCNIHISKLRCILDKITPCTLVYFNMCTSRSNALGENRHHLHPQYHPLLQHFGKLATPKVPNRQKFTSLRSALFLLPTLVMETTSRKRKVHGAYIDIV